MEGNRRRSMLDNTRNNNFLRKSFSCPIEGNVLTRDEYIAALTNENCKWKQMYKEKKKKSNLKSKEIVVTPENVANLATEDANFRREKPDYVEARENAKSYVQNVLFCNKLSADYKQQFEILVEDMEEEIDVLVSRLLEDENRPCLICSNGHCTEELHYLVDRDSQFSDVITNLVHLQL